jgi:putative heme-binding domain-containing protein
VIKTYIKISILTLLLIGFFIYIGEALTRISGLGGEAGLVAGINPEAGETLFWGRGKCHTCHSVGTRGSAIRGPDLDNMGAMAFQRAAERKAQGVSMSATEYLVESIANVSAYVVEGYKDEMPLAFKPPISLTPDEIKAVISYLQTLGGELDIAAIKLPSTIKAATKETMVKWEPYMEGDPKVGEELFFDEASSAACSKCHVVGERGKAGGPDLTHLAGTRTPKFIIDSIFNPSAEIASGFEQMLIRTTDGKLIRGIVRKQDETGIELVDKEGTIRKIPLGDIDRKKILKNSAMPENLANLLTVEEFHNLLAYLFTLE